jgi:hypothetical protein
MNELKLIHYFHTNLLLMEMNLQQLDLNLNLNFLFPLLLIHVLIHHLYFQNQRNQTQFHHLIHPLESHLLHLQFGFVSKITLLQVCFFQMIP